MTYDYMNYIRAGVAVFAAFSALSIGSFFLDCSSKKSSAPVNAALDAGIEMGPDGMIYTDEIADLSGDQTLWNLLKPELIKKNESYKHLFVSKLEGRSFVRPLGHESSLGRFDGILGSVKKEFEYLGLNRNYRIKALRSISDLSEFHPDIVWLVADLGLHIFGRVEMTTHDNRIDTGRFKLINSNNGSVLSDYEWDAENGSCCLKNYFIFIRSEAKDPVDAHIAVYSELFHAELQKIKLQLINYFFKRAKTDKGLAFSEKSKADVRTISAIVDESLVHGLSHAWFKENLEIFGFTENDYLSELAQKERLFGYKGVKVMRELAFRQGRKELLADYLKKPC